MGRYFVILERCKLTDRGFAKLDPELPWFALHYLEERPIDGFHRCLCPLGWDHVSSVRDPAPAASRRARVVPYRSADDISSRIREGHRIDRCDRAQQAIARKLVDLDRVDGSLLVARDNGVPGGWVLGVASAGAR
jgi:hypothetical protein